MEDAAYEFESYMETQGILPLQFTAMLLTEPKVLEYIIKRFKLGSENMSLREALKQYRKQYYTRQCLAYREAGECLEGALKLEQRDVVQKAIEKGAVTESNARDVVLLAVKYNNVELLNYVNENYDLVNTRKKQIRMALNEGNTELCIYLLQKFPEAMMAGELFVSAAYYNNMEILKYGVRNLSIRNISEKELYEAFILAVGYGNLHIIKYIAELFPDVKFDMDDAFELAIKKHSLETVMFLNERFHDYAVDINKMLKWSVNYTDKDILYYVLHSMGADPRRIKNVPTLMGWIDIKILEFLIDNGLVIQDTDRIFLVEALYNLNFEVARYLVLNYKIMLDNDIVEHIYDVFIKNNHMEYFETLNELVPASKRVIPKILALAAKKNYKTFEMLAIHYKYKNYKKVLRLIGVKYGRDHRRILLYLLREELIKPEELLKIYLSKEYYDDDMLLLLIERKHIKGRKLVAKYVVSLLSELEDVEIPIYLESIVNVFGRGILKAIFTNAFNQINYKVVDEVLNFGYVNKKIYETLDIALGLGDEKMFEILLHGYDVFKLTADLCETIPFERLTLKMISKFQGEELDELIYLLAGGKTKMFERLEIVKKLDKKRKNFPKDIAMTSAVENDSVKLVEYLVKKHRFNVPTYLKLAHEHDSKRVIKLLENLE